MEDEEFEEAYAESVISYALSLVYGETELPVQVDTDMLQALTSRLTTWVIEALVDLDEQHPDDEAPDEKVREAIDVALSVAYLIGRLHNPTDNPTEPNLPTVLNEELVQKLLANGSVTLTLTVDD